MSITLNIFCEKYIKKSSNVVRPLLDRPECAKHVQYKELKGRRSALMINEPDILKDKIKAIKPKWFEKA